MSDDIDLGRFCSHRIQHADIAISILPVRKSLWRRKLGKTILIVDGAENCAYDCFLADDLLFSAIFPGPGQDIEFIEDFLVRESDGRFDEKFAELWRHRVERKSIRGIDGILFYDLLEKKKYYPNKRDSDLDGAGRQTRQ